MNLWISVKSALTVMDMVTRSWARQLKIDECGVTVLMRLGFRESCSASKLALLCGRARPQVQRSLRILEGEGLARPARVSSKGTTTAWCLTEKGMRRWRSLERAVIAWEETLEEGLDLRQLSAMLDRLVVMAVNRPSADGWRGGLAEPYELRKTPLWFQVSLEDSMLEFDSREETPLPHDEEAARRESEEERAEREWNAMWVRLSS